MIAMDRYVPIANGDVYNHGRDMAPHEVITLCCRTYSLRAAPDRPGILARQTQRRCEGGGEEGVDSMRGVVWA